MTFRPMLIALAFATALASTAPVLAQDHPGHGDTAAAISVGPIEITGAFTRATLPNAPVAGGFLTLSNTGSEDDRLISATAPIARETQIHEMAMDGDIMRMRQLADGIVIPAGESIVLEPGGFHLMFMGLTGPIVEGEVVPVTLVFENAGTVTIDLPAADTAADAPSHEGHDMGPMDEDQM